MRLLLCALVLALAGCSSTPMAPHTTAPPRSWLGMDPGDARTFTGSAGRLLLVVADEAYSIDGENVGALIWREGSDYTTDYVLEDADGTVRWYGRKGSWRAGRHGAEPREVSIVDGTARFGDRTITLADGGPVELATPDGTYQAD
ncbi:MAG TPA: hypothetical protein VFT70_13985 [Nocardioides sp.]|nr:hypothetical protein [Nocardioides sp.]